VKTSFHPVEGRAPHFVTGMSTVGSHGSFLWKALVFRDIKTGELMYFLQTAPLIVPDQKMTAGALKVVLLRW
jgi:hypothetical protein